MSVDLPTPEDPSIATVRPGPRYWPRTSRPWFCRALVAWTGAPEAMASTSANPGVRIVGEVGLGQQDDRLRAALPGGDQVALDPAEVEIGVEAGREEHRVDVGGDDLLAGRVACDLPREPTAPRQDREDRRAQLARPGTERDPVADGRVFDRGRRLVAQLPGHAGQELARARSEPGRCADARGPRARGRRQGRRGLGRRSRSGRSSRGSQARAWRTMRHSRSDMARAVKAETHDSAPTRNARWPPTASAPSRSRRRRPAGTRGRTRRR